MVAALVVKQDALPGWRIPPDLLRLIYCDGAYAAKIYRPGGELLASLARVGRSIDLSSCPDICFHRDFTSTSLHTDRYL